MPVTVSREGDMNNPARQRRWKAVPFSLLAALGALLLLLVAVPGSHGAGRGRSVRAVPAGRVRLFAADPGLRAALGGLPPASARAAEGLVVGSWHLKPGTWDPVDNPQLEDPDCSYLVLEGLLLSHVRVGSRASAELLGPGDLFTADDADTHGYASVPSERSFRVLHPARVVALDTVLLARIHSVPGMVGHFQGRLTQRARSLNLRLAIVQIPQLATRLHLLLWHLADRWGHRSPKGTVIPFRLSHAVLADCVSAQRTSVVAALHELRDSGAVERTQTGHWVLHEDPPADFR